MPDQSPADELRAAARQWVRPFNVHVTGPDRDYVLHGAEFPSGRVVTDDPERGLAFAAVSVESLLERFASGPETATVIWPEGTPS